MLLLRDLMKLISKPETVFINGEREQAGVGVDRGQRGIYKLIKLRDSKLLLNVLLSSRPPTPPPPPTDPCLLPPILGGVPTCTRPPHLKLPCIKLVYKLKLP